MKTLKKITLIGSGNVATHLGMAFHKQQYHINTIYSKTQENATILANKVNALATNVVEQLDDTSDIYIIAIKDDNIDSFLKSFPFKDQLIVHTSGNVSIDVFKANGYKNYGILYPLQTFSKDRNVDMNEVPFCIEGSDKKTEDDLIHFANNISSKVYSINSEQRKKIHLAAVFACNFTNYMYTISEELLIKNNIDFELLKPLIIETAKKIIDNSPKTMQTGPAKRNDKAVLENHINLLADSPSYQSIYQLISEHIITSS